MKLGVNLLHVPMLLVGAVRCVRLAAAETSGRRLLPSRSRSATLQWEIMMRLAGLALLMGAVALPASAQSPRPVPNLSTAAPPAPGPLPGPVPGGVAPPGSDELVDPTTGCKVVRADTEPDMSITWSGECYHGLAHGKGVLQWFQAGKPLARYEGEMQDGMAHGIGKMTYANGSRYDGAWENGERNGKGTFSFPNGSRLSGEFRDGKPNGRATYLWSNGDRYVGDFRENKRTGHGTLFFANGDRYEGEFVDGKAQGRGVRTYAAGGRYDGEWRDDVPNGYGTRYSADGRSYSGLWQNGCFRDGDRWATVGVSAERCGFR